TLHKLGPAETAFVTQVISNGDEAALSPAVWGWVKKSEAERLGYTTILEMLAEQSHASEEGLRQLNPEVVWPDPAEGTAVVLPNPRPFRLKPASEIRISLSRKVLRVYDENKKTIAWFPCSIAKDKNKRPQGLLTIQNCADDPTYLFDSNLFAEDAEAYALNKRLVIPPGPNNPVGVAWIGLSLPGYGIHGTPVPEDIGKTESHGCFRLSNWNAEKLMKMIRIGTPVMIED
ncbi:MAG: L,D-transpeptidase, partial [Lentisphaerota bacterium]